MSLFLSLALIAAQPAQSNGPVVQMNGPGGLTATLPLQPDKDDARLVQASAFIAKGQPAAALPLADQVIAEHEAKYRANNQVIYFSARSLGEGLIYGGLAGVVKKNGVILNGDWTLAYS